MAEEETPGTDEETPGANEAIQESETPEENLDEATEDQRPMPQLTKGASRSPGEYTGQESKLTLSCRAWRVLRFVELPSQKVLRISSREPSVQNRFRMSLAQQ